MAFDQSQFNDPTNAFRFDNATLRKYIRSQDSVAMVCDSRRRRANRSQFERDHVRVTSYESSSERSDESGYEDGDFGRSASRASSFATFSSSGSASSASSSSLPSSVAETFSRVSNYFAFSKRMRDLVRERTNENAARYRLREIRDRSLPRIITPRSRFSPSFRADGNDNNNNDDDYTNIDSVLDRRTGTFIGKRDRVRYVGGVLLALERKLCTLLGRWRGNRGLKLYRACVRFVRLICLLRVPIYMGMTVIGIYAYIDHLLTTEEVDMLIFFDSIIRSIDREADDRWQKDEE